MFIVAHVANGLMLCEKWGYTIENLVGLYGYSANVANWTSAGSAMGSRECCVVVITKFSVL